MAFRFPNLLKATLRYMRGDDITEANARTLARNRADLASADSDRAFQRPAAAAAGVAPATSLETPKAAA
jgi:hypothetical protein